MHNSREPETSRKRKRRKDRRSRFRLVSYSLVVCIVAAGCESDFGGKRLGDPFLGIHTAPKQTETAGAPSSPTVAQAASGPVPVPPMPPSYTAPGTAGMASGETGTPQNPRALRITGDTGSPVPSYPPLNRGGGSGAGAARGVAPAVTVGNPEPTPSGATANFTKPASPPPGGSAANIRTFEDAQQILKQHGVTWQSMSQDQGEWKFSCGIPNPSNPHYNKTYQTSRPFPDLLSAMSAVIAQIEQMPH